MFGHSPKKLRGHIKGPILTSEPLEEGKGPFELRDLGFRVEDLEFPA